MNSLHSISRDTLIHIFDYLNTTKLKINHNMSLNEVLEIIQEVQNIQKRQQIYFKELNCKCIIRELKLQKKNNYIQEYIRSVIYDYGDYEYLYYD